MKKTIADNAQRGLFLIAIAMFGGGCLSCEKRPTKPVVARAWTGKATVRLDGLEAIELPLTVEAGQSVDLELPLLSPLRHLRELRRGDSMPARWAERYRRALAAIEAGDQKGLEDAIGALKSQWTLRTGMSVRRPDERLKSYFLTRQEALRRRLNPARPLPEETEGHLAGLRLAWKAGDTNSRAVLAAAEGLHRLGLLPDFETVSRGRVSDLLGRPARYGEPRSAWLLTQVMALRSRLEQPPSGAGQRLQLPALQARLADRIAAGQVGGSLIENVVLAEIGVCLERSLEECRAVTIELADDQGRRIRTRTIAFAIKTADETIATVKHAGADEVAFVSAGKEPSDSP